VFSSYSAVGTDDISKFADLTWVCQTGMSILRAADTSAKPPGQIFQLFANLKVLCHAARHLCYYDAVFEKRDNKKQ